MTPSGMVDAHAHVFASSVDERRSADDLAPAERRADVEELWAVAEPCGVSSAVLVPLDTDDATAAAALAAYPGRCAGVAVAGPEDLGEGAASRLRARRERYPFDAVRMSWLGDLDRPLDESAAWPLLTAMAEQDLVLWSYLGPEQATWLPVLARELPELRVVLNHLGFAPAGMVVDEARRPRFPGALDADAVERVAALAEHPGMHLMVSGHYALTREHPPYADLEQATHTLVAAFGADRCLWGSDFPWITTVPGYAATLDAARRLLGGLPPSDLELVLGGTARRMFRPTLEEERT